MIPKTDNSASNVVEGEERKLVKKRDNDQFDRDIMAGGYAQTARNHPEGSERCEGDCAIHNHFWHL